nr:MAG TPA: hypothetical protein [Caudoviricetes sp.]
MKTRLNNDELMKLCIRNNWFTCGSSRQYKKLFEMNQQGAPIEQIATVIWLCSDEEVPENCRRDIIFALHEASFTERERVSEEEQLTEWLGI